MELLKLQQGAGSRLLAQCGVSGTDVESVELSTFARCRLVSLLSGIARHYLARMWGAVAAGRLDGCVPFDTKVDGWSGVV